MAQSFKQGGDPANYTIGGIRAWFNRLADDSTTPVKFEGFRDLGNVVEAPQESESEEVEHFSAKTGTRKKDRKVNTDIAETITLTLDEPNLENLRHFFRGGTVTDIAASAGNTAPEEIIKLDREDTVNLHRGRTATAIIVKDFADVVTYILDTDYRVVEVLSSAGDSWKGIERIAAGAIADGEFVRVDYDFDIEAHREFAPQTALNVEGRLLLFGISDTGNEFIRSIEKVSLAPEGAFDLDDEDFSTFQLLADILDNTDSDPSFPFGVFEHYGTGSDLA